MEPIDPSPDLTPLILLVDDQEWTSRSIESILRPKGYVVLKAYTAQQALDLVSKVSPDAVLVDANLPDMSGAELIRKLKASSTIHGTTPILMVSSSSMGRARRLEALGAGAWDTLTHPVDPNELILRLDTLVRAKQEADRVRDEGLTDPSTGLYNVRGILQRTKELSADAQRFARSLTCVALGTGHAAGTELEGRGAFDVTAEAVGRPIADALREVTRLSDTLGCLGPGEFVVIAPGTSREGGLRLVDRVLERLDQTADTDAGLGEPLKGIRAGLCAIDGSEGLSPEDLLLRATMALRKAQGEEGSFRVRAHEA